MSQTEATVETYSNDRHVYVFRFHGAEHGVNYKKSNVRGFVLHTSAYTYDQARRLIERLVLEGFVKS